MIREREVRAVPGGPVALVLIAVGVGLIVTIFANIKAPWVVISCAVGIERRRRADGGAVHRPAERGRRCFSSSADTSARSSEPGLRWANPFYTKRKISAAHPQLREQPAQGQRPRRQPDRDRGRRRLARRRHGRGGVRGGRLSRTSCTCSRSRRCATWRPTTPTTRTRTSKMSLRGNTAEVAEQLQAGDPGPRWPRRASR